MTVKWALLIPVTTMIMAIGLNTTYASDLPSAGQTTYRSNADFFITKLKPYNE